MTTPFDTELFTLREGRADDMPLLNHYANLEGMDAFPSHERITVAVNADDVPVGFIRIRVGEDGRAFVNPIITLSTWRGYGVGRALMNYARSVYGDLYLVARGKAVGFYRALGLVNASWDEMILDFCEDCDSCTIREECCPQPMKWVGDTAHASGSTNSADSVR